MRSDFSFTPTVEVQRGEGGSEDCAPYKTNKKTHTNTSFLRSEAFNLESASSRRSSSRVVNFFAAYSFAPVQRNNVLKPKRTLVLANAFRKRFFFYLVFFYLEGFLFTSNFAPFLLFTSKVFFFYLYFFTFYGFGGGACTYIGTCHRGRTCLGTYFWGVLGGRATMERRAWALLF